jgi:hypothetical protein
MAAAKLTDLTALAGEAVATGDFLYIGDVSATTAGSKKITLAEFHETYPVVITTALAGSGLHATEDKFPVWDNGVPKYMLSTELQNGLFATATAITSGLHATQDTLLYDDNGAAKKITVPNLFAGAVVLATAIDTGYHATQDHLLYDDNGVMSKITVPNLVEAAFILTSTELAGSGVAGGDQLLIGDGTAGSAVPKYVTVTGLTTAIASLGFTLADIPEYADQAAAATGLTGTGRLFRFATTGALGVTIT